MLGSQLKATKFKGATSVLERLCTSGVWRQKRCIRAVQSPVHACIHESPQPYMYIRCLYYSYSPGFCSLLLLETRPELEGHLFSSRMAIPQTDLETLQQSKCIRMHLQLDPASSICPNLLTWCCRDPVLFQLRTAGLLKANPEKEVNILFWVQYTKLTCTGITCVEQKCSTEGHGLVGMVVMGWM